MEERLRACGVLGPGEEIDRAVEVVSFDDTLGILQEVVGGDLKGDRTIPVCSEEMYEVIANFNRGLKSDRTARCRDVSRVGVTWAGPRGSRTREYEGI